MLTWRSKKRTVFNVLRLINSYGIYLFWNVVLVNVEQLLLEVGIGEDDFGRGPVGLDAQEDADGLQHLLQDLRRIFDASNLEINKCSRY